VVAVERGDKVIVEFEDGFVVQPQDAVFICGSIKSLERYQREFHANTAPATRPG
jgi:Trk K+ transport system NAD-binding subunit